MNGLVKQMADDLRTVSRAMDRMEIEMGVMRRWMDGMRERDDFCRILRGLQDRGLITQSDADKALDGIESGKDNQKCRQ